MLWKKVIGIGVLVIAAVVGVYLLSTANLLARPDSQGNEIGGHAEFVDALHNEGA